MREAAAEMLRVARTLVLVLCARSVSPSRDAWVYMASRCTDLLQVLSSVRTLRTVGSLQPVVVLAFDDLAAASGWDSGPLAPLLEALGMSVRRTTPPQTPDTVAPSTGAWLDQKHLWWSATKVRTWSLHDVADRAVFVDGDVFFVGAPMDDWFELPECSRGAGASNNPFNTGFFRADPNATTHAALVTIATEGSFEAATGWNRQCDFPQPKPPNGRLCDKGAYKVRGGGGSQGILAYYCDDVRRDRPKVIFPNWDHTNRPYGCQRNSQQANGTCRSAGVRAVHATGACRKHPFSCACPDFYEKWWAAHSETLAFLRRLPAGAVDATTFHCLAPTTERRRRGASYWARAACAPEPRRPAQSTDAA